ncbi:MAG: FtsH protease activity modulator HflK [Acetanaerobacterium sp.]
MNSKKAVRSITVAAIIVILAIVLFANSFYTVNTGQEVVIQRFGRYDQTIARPGVSFKIPFIDKKTVVDVNGIHRMEFGFNTVGQNQFEEDYEGAKMLTGDENIALVEAIVQYQIKDSKDYLFQVNDIEGTLRVISESAIRRVVASHPLDDSLTNNKSGVQSEILQDLQYLCDKYQSGIKIVNVQLQDVSPPTEVDEAFRDVAGALEDKNSYINEANAYLNEIIPTARGEAATAVNAANGYAVNRVAAAEAEVTAYEQLYERYTQSTRTTRSRMYLEMMGEVLKGVDIYIMDDANGVKLFNMNQ